MNLKKIFSNDKKVINDSIDNEEESLEDIVINELCEDDMKVIRDKDVIMGGVA